MDANKNHDHGTAKIMHKKKQQLAKNLKNSY